MAIQEKNTKTPSLSLFVLYIILTMVIYMLPAVKLLVPYILAGSFMLLFLPVAMMRMQHRPGFFMLLLGSAFVSAALYFANGFMGTTDAINEAIRYIRFFLPVTWAVYALRFCTPKQRRNLLIFFGIITVFILFKTIKALEADEWVTRILAQDKTADSAEIRAYRMGNIGGFEFSYMMGVVVLCLVWAALKCKKAMVRVLSIVGAVVGFYYIIQTMYMTLLILTSAGILLLLLFNTKNILTRVLLIFGSIALVFSIVPLCKYLSEVFSGSLLSEKFLQFYTALTGGGADSLGSRPGLIADALERWLQSPIWGGYGFSVATHSMIFSILEATGLIGLFAFLGCILSGYKWISLELRKQNVPTGLLSIVFGYIIVLSVLNPIGYVFEVTIAAFFITPLWSTLLCANDSSASKKQAIEFG